MATATATATTATLFQSPFDSTATNRDHERLEISRRDPAVTPNFSSEDLVVHADALDFTTKHPLQNSWTLWYDNPGKRTNSKSWGQTLREIFTFDAVEDFWGVYNNVVRASEIPTGSTFHFFKAGIKPEWEDRANSEGGCWKIQYPKKIGDEIDGHWLRLMLSCIGEHFEHEEHLCGVVLGVRNQFYRMSVWTRNATDQEAAEAIGRQFKESVGHTNVVFYAGHQTHAISYRV